MKASFLYRAKHHKLNYLLLLPILCVSCSNALVDDIKRGAGYNYIPGYPELRLEVSEHISETEETSLKITGHVVHNSLIFKKIEDDIGALINVEVALNNHTTNQNENFDFQAQVNRGDTTSPEELSDISYDEEVYIFEREVEADPGAYTVSVSVTDLSSQKAIVRKADAFLPDPAEEITNITNIGVLTKDDQSPEYATVTTYDVSEDSDSIKFVFQVTNNKADDPITINSRLLKFNSDSSIAQPMSYSNPSASNLAYKGIEYRDYDVVQSTERELTQPGNVVMEFVFTNLQRGNYRFEVAEDFEDKEILYKARDFGIKSHNYPSLKSPRELAKPLVYLMGGREYKRLLAIESDDSLKSAIDRFWLQNIQNSVIAKNVISLYYQRVEEANKFFSNFKEGWKTDLGMVYILFGPPLDEYKRLRELRWSYRYDQTDPDYTYFFRATKTKTHHYPFEHYVLQRSNHFFNIEYRQRRLWLSGDILQHNM